MLELLCYERNPLITTVVDASTFLVITLYLERKMFEILLNT